MATTTAFVCAPASATGWATAPPVRLPLARQRRPSPPLPPSGALPARRRSRRGPYQHHKLLQLPTAVADGTHGQGRAVAADMGGRGAASDVDGEGDAGGSSSSIVGGGSGDSDGGGPGVRRLALEAEVLAVTGACAPAAKPRARARRDPEAGGDAGGIHLSSPISPPPPSGPPSARRGIGTFADLSDATSAAHLYVGGLAVPRHRWSRRHRAAGVYRSVEYRVLGLDAVDASTGERTPYASTADAAAAGVPPADLVASLVPARRLLPRFDRPGGWPVEVGVVDARLLSFKADIACSLAVTLALAASFLAVGVGGPSVGSVYVVNSASMEPTVAVGDALVVEKVSLRGLTRGGGGRGRGMAVAAVAAPAATAATPEAAALSASAAGETAGQAAMPLPPGPRVGEVVLFHPPVALRQRAAADGTVLHAKDAFVKRVVAVAGDTVEVRGGLVSVNGVRVGGLSTAVGGATGVSGGAPAPPAAAAPAAQPTSESRPPPAVTTATSAAAAAAADPPPAGRLRRGNVGGGALPPDVRLVVGDGQLFVLGDNAPHSCDSRYWGLLPVTDVVGRPVGRVWPPSRAALTRLGGPSAGASARMAAVDAAAGAGASAAAFVEGPTGGTANALWPSRLPPP